MSKRIDKLHHLLNNSAQGSGARNDDARLQRIFNSGMHGISFSAYQDGQQPGDSLTESQIEARMAILAPHFKWIRSFSTTQGHEMIPSVAKRFGLKTLVGAWLGADTNKNQLETEALIDLGRQGLVDIAAVGNEVLYREEMSESALLAGMSEVRARLPRHIPMGYVDAYYEFENRPALTAACDVLLTNCYPYWEGCALPYATLYMQDMYRRVQKVAGGKRVIITETGWPSAGGAFYGAEASTQGAYQYFLRAQEWALLENIEMFYFSSFDESWKAAGDAGEGDVGAFWGLWDSHENFKYAAKQ